ncbi:MAG: DUF4276 family protein [Gammaproteobacteria bacterium]
MKELVFLLEEESARAMLLGLLPRVLDPQVQPRLMVFEGKQDLEKQMVKRMRGYVNPLARFIVLRDQDRTPDCKVVKAKLLRLCAQAGRQAVSLVRIACRELESFYLADLRAVEAALGLTGLVRHQNTARFRIADHVESPSRELAKLTHRAYQKVSGSRQLGPHLEIANDRSASFKNLIAGVRRLEQELLALSDAY